MSDERYKYDPSLAAAVIFIVCFGLSGIYHVFQVVRLKSWYFIPFIIGCLVEVIGYVGRALNASEKSGQWTQGPYIIQALLLLLGPPFYAASIYMVLGRLIRLLDAEKYSMVKLKWLTKFFLLGDIASILGQGAGGGMLASADSKKSRDLGQTIIIVGLAIQIIFFTFFVIIAITFDKRIRREPTKASLAITSPWKKLLQVLYGSSALILVRSVFRVVEYVLGKDGELMAKEVYIYIFDATMMLLVAISFNIFHPSAIINKKNKRNSGIPSSDVELNAVAYTG
ncbi:RTA1 like protein-domain-containing protein [Ilyonectria robusta]|uniref:RTA1 like protein-domain-containing protein n=1 Tax=Ilyonectria robusta TaxID=1079257 RepID=UPI001E8CBD40|nr:RTA1 like protein-domain-containing protein [Ilyonectria robusta]KAH8654391.1 RTA1 like protein-domain-containing protein [Ilyonectria robusta]